MKKKSKNSSKEPIRRQRVRAVVEERQYKSGASYRIRLHVGGERVHTIGARKLKGLTRDEVEAKAAAVAAAYEKQYLTGAVPAKITATLQPVTSTMPRATEKVFSYEEAKERFFDWIEDDIDASRRVTVESYFRLSIEPFFIKKRKCANPEEWPPLFRQYRPFARKRPLSGSRKMDVKARTVNLHIAVLNKFLKFCREDYGLNISRNCERFGKKVIEKELKPVEDNQELNGASVWTETLIRSSMVRVCGPKQSMLSSASWPTRKLRMWLLSSM